MHLADGLPGAANRYGCMQKGAEITCISTPSLRIVRTAVSAYFLADNQSTNALISSSLNTPSNAFIPLPP